MTATTVRLGRVAVLGATLFAVLGVYLVSIAQAAPYTSSDQPRLSTSSPGPGAAVAMSGGGFKVGSSVQAIIYSEPVVLGTSTVNAAGEASMSVTIPESFAAGSTHELTLQGVTPSGATRVLSQTITLAGGENELAYTGAVVVPLIAVGGGLLLAGGFMVTRGRAHRGAGAR